MQALAQALQNLGDWLTLHLTMWILVGTGLYLTIRLRGVQFRLLPAMVRSILSSRAGCQRGYLLLPGLHYFPSRARGYR